MTFWWNLTSFPDCIYLFLNKMQYSNSFSGDFPAQCYEIKHEKIWLIMIDF